MHLEVFRSEMAWYLQVYKQKKDKTKMVKCGALLSLINRSVGDHCVYFF